MNYSRSNYLSATRNFYIVSESNVLRVFSKVKPLRDVSAPDVCISAFLNFFDRSYNSHWSIILLFVNFHLTLKKCLVPSLGLGLEARASIS